MPGNDAFARASELLGGSMPPVHRRVRLTDRATPEAVAALGEDAARLAAALRDGPRTSLELIGDSGWSVDAARALARLHDAGFLAVEPALPTQTAPLLFFLALAFAGALIAIVALPSFWRGQPLPAFAGLALLVIASGGALATAMKKR